MIYVRISCWKLQLFLVFLNSSVTFW